MTQPSNTAAQELNFTPETLGTFGGSDDGVISASTDALLETINLASSNDASGGGFDFYENTTGSLTFGIVPKFTVGGGATTIGYDLSLPQFTTTTDKSITTDFNTSGWSQTSASLTSTGFDPAQDTVSLNLVFDANNVSASAGESNDYPFIPNVNISTPTVNLGFDDELIGINPGDLPKGAVGLTVEYPGTEGAVTANATLPDGAAVADSAGSDDSISTLSGSNTSDDNVLGLNIDLIAAMRAYAEDKAEKDPAAADLAADLSVIDGEIGSSGFNVHWALGTAILSGGIKLGEDVSFAPTSETVTFQTPYQTVTGNLGQDFQLDNPAGVGSYQVNATYSITGTLTSVLQAVLNAGLTLEMLTAGITIAGVSWDSDPLVKKDFDLGSTPIDLYTKTQTVTLTYTEQYTVSYDDPNPTYHVAATPVSGEYFGHPGETIELATTDPGNDVTLLSPAPTTGSWNYDASTGVISYTFGATTTDDDLQSLKFHIAHDGYVRSLDESLNVLDLPVQEPTFTPYSAQNVKTEIISTYLDRAPTDENLSAGFFSLDTDNGYDKFSVTLADDSLSGASGGSSISTRTGSYAITGGVADDAIFVNYKPGEYNGSKAFTRKFFDNEECYVADDTLTLTLQDLTTGLTYTGIKDKVTVAYSIPELDGGSPIDIVGPDSSAAFGTVYPDYASPSNIYTIKMTGDALFGTSGGSALTIDGHGDVTYRAGVYSIKNATAADLANGYIDDKISYTLTNTLTGVSSQGSQYVRLDLAAPSAFDDAPQGQAFLLPGGEQTDVMHVSSANGADPLSITLLDNSLFTTKSGSTTTTSSSLFLDGDEVTYKAGPMPSLYNGQDDTTDTIKYKLTDAVTGVSKTGMFYVNITAGDVPVANIATIETYEKSVKETDDFIVADTAANIIADLSNLNKDPFVSAIDVDDKVGYQATLSQAATLIGSPKVARFIVGDSAADVAAASPTLLGNALIAAVELTDASSVAEAATLAADSKIGAFTIADTKANVGAALADESLVADTTLTSITLTDATLKSKASWTLDAAEYIADAGTLAKIAPLTVPAVGAAAATTTPAYALTVTDATVADAAELQADATVTSFAVADSSANVEAALAVLNSDTKLTSITFTDATAPALTIGYGTFADNSLALSKISKGTTIVVEGASASAAAKLQASDVTSFTVADTAADVAANSKALNAASKLSKITITTGAVASDAASLQDTDDILSFGVSDTAANVAKALDSLNLDTKLTSIALTDANVLTLTVAEALDDTRALTEIKNANYTIVIDDSAAAIVANLAALSGNSRISAIVPNGAVSVAVAEQLQTLKSASKIQVRDTTADIQAALGALNYTVVTNIAFSDTSSPTLALTYAQFSSASLMSALKAGGAKLTITIDNATVAGAAALNSSGSVSAFTVADTAADVAQGLASLSGYHKLAAIVLTGGGTPTLTLSVAQATTYAAALAKIENANFAIAISDTAAHVAAAFDALNALPHLASMALTDQGTPTLTLTVAEALHDTAALGAISNKKYAVAISDTAADVYQNSNALAGDLNITSVTLTSAATAAEASQLQTLAKLASFTVSDSAANVEANLATLSADSKLNGLTLTDAKTLAISYSEYTADSALVNRLKTQTGFFVVTGASVAAAAALQSNAAVGAFTVADSSQNVMSQLAKLASDTKITSVTLTDATALTVGYSAYSADAHLFGLFVLPGGFTVTGAAVAQAANLQAQAAITSFTVADSASDVANALKALGGYSKLKSISLTGSGAQTLALSAADAIAYQGLLGLIANARVVVSDTAAHVLAEIDSLNGDSEVKSIELTDSGTPTLTLTVAQALQDTTALGEIASAKVTIKISDTAANVAANATALNADGRISAITLTTAATVAEAAQLQTLAALTSFNVQDTPADVAADLTELNGELETRENPPARVRRPRPADAHPHGSRRGYGGARQDKRRRRLYDRLRRHRRRRGRRRPMAVARHEHCRDRSDQRGDGLRGRDAPGTVTDCLFRCRRQRRRRLRRHRRPEHRHEARRDHADRRRRGDAHALRRPGARRYDCAREDPGSLSDRHRRHRRQRGRRPKRAER